MNNPIWIEGREFVIEKGTLRVLRLRNEWIDRFDDPDRMISSIKKIDVRSDLLTFIHPIPIQGERYPLYNESENLAVLEISTYQNWISHQVHRNTRKKVRRAEREGIVVKVQEFDDSLALGLVGIFNEVPRRRGKKYPYYGWDLQEVKRGWATELERSLWLVAYSQDNVVGFIKLVHGNGIARASGTLAKIAYRDKAPMNALFAKAVEICVEWHIRFLIYGRFEYGKKGRDTLTEFKLNNGFRKMDIPRYYVPLSIKGRMALRFRLHRGWKSLIPRPIIRSLLRIRAILSKN